MEEDKRIRREKDRWENKEREREALEVSHTATLESLAVLEAKKAEMLREIAEVKTEHKWSNPNRNTNPNPNWR